MAVNSTSTFFPTTRFSLLGRLGDPAALAWDEFFAVYGPLIYRMARHARLGEDTAEDVVAVVMHNFVGTMKRGFQFDPQQGRFRQYLRTITNRTILLHRLQGPMAKLQVSDHSLVSTGCSDNLPDAAWEEAEREERWQVCLERIRLSSVVSPRDFAAFEALVLLGEPAEKVAKRFGVTTNRLYGIRHSVIRRLRQIREELDGELGEV